MAINNILTFAETALGEKKYVYLITIDFQNAFNSLEWPIIKQVIKEMKIPTYLRNVINDFLKDRKVFIDDQEEINYNKGVPQGSSLGPILWLLVMNTIFEINKNKKEVILQAFADDVIIGISGPSISKIINLSVGILEDLSNWAIKHKLKINYKKCFYTLLHKGLEIREPRTIKIDNNNIKYTGELEYLGVLIDPKLSWFPHLERVNTKIINFCEKIKRVSRATWGIKGEIIKTMYIQGMEKIIMYGSEAWYRDHVKIKNKLISIQRHCLKVITKCYSDVSNEALQTLSGCPPIYLKIQNTKKLFNLRVNGYQLESNGLLFNKENTEFFKRKIDPKNPLSINWKYYKGENYDFNFYTDGSKMENGVGCAFTVFQDSTEIDYRNYRLNNEANIFEAEAFAIFMALKRVKEQKISNACIITDSRSNLQALENPIDSNELSFKIRNLYRAMIESGVRVQMYWIKAHAGFAGNERADFLAKESIRKETVEIKLKFNESFLKRNLKIDMKKKWQELWNKSSKGRTTYVFFPKVSFNYCHSNFFLNQVYTGHGIFPDYQHQRFGKSEICLCGTGTGTAEHILFDCLKFSDLREKFMNNLKTRDLKNLLKDEKCRQGVEEIIVSYMKLALES